jgi:hypothetical protein
MLGELYAFSFSFSFAFALRVLRGAYRSISPHATRQAHRHIGTGPRFFKEAHAFYLIKN